MKNSGKSDNNTWRPPVRGYPPEVCNLIVRLRNATYEGNPEVRKCAAVLLRQWDEERSCAYTGTH
jgi:hypothetical protein